LGQPVKKLEKAGVGSNLKPMNIKKEKSQGVGKAPGVGDDKNKPSTA